MAREDVLGQGYVAEDLTLEPDDEGPVVATLVRWPARPASDRAVLYVHGYNDYFYQADMGPRLAAAGWDLYALDLRKYGRSLRPWQTHAFVRDLAEHFPELDEAVARARGRDGHRRLLLAGHSAGGLLCALYARARRDRGTLDAVALNAPFLAFHGGPFVELLAARVVPALGRLRPRQVIPAPADPFYAWSLHRGFGKGGEWAYDLAWKTPGTLPLHAGWVAAIRRGHRLVQRGLALEAPTLVISSARSGGGPTWNPSYLETDTVLDVDDIERIGRGLGARVTCERVEGALHDVLASRRAVRDEAYARLLRWAADAVPA